MSNALNKFSAANSALGYLYQFRFAINLLLKSEENSQIELETVDDIVLSDDSTTLHQLKHHGNPGNLTDSSPDLWKTLRVWCEYIKANPDSETKFLLVTTAIAANDSIAELLKSESSKKRNPQLALERLIEIANKSKNESIKTSLDEFNNLTPFLREKLVKSIIVVDKHGSFEPLEKEIKKYLSYGVRSNFIEQFFEHVEGWWCHQIIKVLLSERVAISRVEVMNFIHDTQEQYRIDNLPIHFSELVTLPSENLTHEDKIFVKQLKLVMVRQERILLAVQDYYRAFQQRSRWLRSGLLLPSELDRYEARLIDEWKRLFWAELDEVSNDHEESDKKRVGRSIFNQIDGRDIRIRERCSEPYVMRGSFQILADNQKIGWHPDFVSLLKNIVSKAQEAAA